MYLAYSWVKTGYRGWRAVILLKTLVLVATYLLVGLFAFDARTGRAAMLSRSLS